MEPTAALLAGIVAAAVAAVLYYFNRRLGAEHRALRITRAACYVAVAAVIPAVVYLVIDFEHSTHLFWWGMVLAVLLALLFFATLNSEAPWALTFGMGGL